MGAIERFDHSLSAGGIVMIVIAAIGVLTAFTTIICLFVTSKKRSRVNQRLESASSRPVTSPRSPNRPQSLNPPPSLSPHIRTHLPMFVVPELAKYPPTYEEAMRMPSSPTTPITPNASRAITPSGTPPPVFEEAQSHPLVSSLTPTNHLTPSSQQQQHQQQQISNPTKNNESTTVVDETASTNENAK